MKKVNEKKLKPATAGLADVTKAVEQTFAHQHSSHVMMQRDLLLHEDEALKREIGEVEVSLQQARERRRVIGANVAGLNAVLGRR